VRRPPDPFRVARALRARYGRPRVPRSDPLEELLWLLCSTKTTGRGCETAWRALRRKFPSLGALARAPARSIAPPLRPAGLHRQRARTLKAVCREVERRFGRLTLNPVRRMPVPACEEFLLSLPGVGRKVARCTMLFALGLPVFPVDTHCARIGARLRWVRPRRPGGAPSDADADRLQEAVPAPLCLDLHVNFIRLGRELCRAGRPLCAPCPLRRLCPSARLRP
jgi:endonuclease III